MPEWSDSVGEVFRPFDRQVGPGAPPGSLVADPTAPTPEISLFVYGPDSYHEESSPNLKDLGHFFQPDRIIWLNIEGLGDAATIREIGDLFALHPLALEDVIHVHQRAKVEDYESHLFIVSRMVSLTDEVITEQISLFLGSNFVITFQEGRPGDCFEHVRAEIRNPQSRIRSRGPDYLAYSLLDATIDSYFPVLEAFGNRLDELDEELSTLRQGAAMARLHRMRAELLLVRKSIWPHRDAAMTLLRDTHTLVRDETRPYLRDCYDHTVQIIDVVETYREMCSELREFFFSKIGQNTNEIMKVLTIISSIFIPLSFIAGVYGMNFEYMPELKWHYGYPLALLLMGALGGAMATLIWRHGWLRP